MNEILFVDDDHSVLGAFENVLRKMRKRWNVRFACSGEAALAAMRVTPSDVVVSDMRMPGMNGAELLERIKAHFPHSRRVLLTGQAERASIARVLPIVHQVLTKPCELEILVATVDLQCRISGQVPDAELRPTPQAHAALMQAAKDPNAKIAALSAIVETDPAMAAKVLQWANSGYFELTQPCAEIQTAVALIGAKMLKEIVGSCEW